jgi:hypothetical protein
MLSRNSWPFDISQELVVCWYEHRKKVEARLVIFDFGGTYGSRARRFQVEISRPDLCCLCLTLTFLKSLSKVPRVFLLGKNL